MTITLNATTGITTPGMVNSGSDAISGNETVAGTLQVGGITTNVYPVVAGTAVASTSGTSIDFTSIPSWVKRITVMFNGVSVSGTSIPIIQIGSTTISTTGYTASGGYANNSAVSTVTAQTIGFPITGVSAATAAFFGNATLTLIASNTWVFSWSGTQTGGTATFTGGGGVSPALGGALDRVRITTVNGTDTFDAGSVNILYE
jgi:hypothetical protein